MSVEAVTTNAAALAATSAPSAPMASPVIEPMLIDTEDVLKLLGGLSRAGYHKARSTGRFAPQPIKIGKKVLHRLQEVKDWINAGCPPAHKWEWCPQ